MPSRHPASLVTGAVAWTATAMTAWAGPREDAWRASTGYAGQYVIIQEDTAARPPFTFNAEDNALLDEIQRATFQWFWDSPAVAANGLIKDRTSGPLISTAGVGYQLGALIVGVERGYITRSQGERRAIQILQGLAAQTLNRKNGMFYHFLKQTTLETEPFADGVSTIDTAILFAGALTASSYFGGEVAQLGDALVDQCDWNFFTMPASSPAWMRGMVTLGWRPTNWADPTGAGAPLNAVWVEAAAEERLIYFIGSCGPTASRRLDSSLYYRLWRNMGSYRSSGPMLQTMGPLFRSFFDQLWIDDASIGAVMGPDRPDVAGFGFRTPTDWWENARRHATLHREKAIFANPGFATVTGTSWGMSASDGPSGYNVPALHPSTLTITGAQPFTDIRPWAVADDWRDGTVAPYTAGCTIMFDPVNAMAALRFYRSLEGAGGTARLWASDYGFFDAYNVPTGGGSPWVAPDRVSIDQGPLLLAIENARTGLITDAFHRHPYVQAAMQRLALRRE